MCYTSCHDGLHANGENAYVNLYEAIAGKVLDWKRAGYPHAEFSTIGEILDWAGVPEGSGFLLRAAQLRALETYWYLRLEQNTPHILDLYERLFPAKRDRLSALGISNAAYEEADYELDALWEKVATDDGFVGRHRFEALRETAALAYPSYILALAMGAGKTVLIGAIIATEFAMALEYPAGSFVRNALVFAPGKTIIESLRELAEVPYDRILPPRLHKPFAASVKLTFTRDGDPDIPIIQGSVYNVVVTNTEKIRIQKETIRKKDLGATLFSASREDEARTEVANRRLLKIASLPSLAVFSDEAHHTYGQAMDTGLKKVRKTVDYLAAATDLVCVVNTTGTPYFRRQPLRDVVVWYGLSEGIQDGVLKEVAGNIFSFSFDDSNTDQYVAHVVEDFFRDYGSVMLPNGAPAKLAMYFPQTGDLAALRPVIEAALGRLGHSPDIVLRNTSESTQAEIDNFNRLSDPQSSHRVILLVNKGTEGWNCPSLFACALARRLRTSNNFVLQAASRCLRQIPDNVHKARIYLSEDNRSTLDRELQETYGETIDQLNHTTHERRSATIRLRKVDVPPLRIRQIVRTVVRKDATAGPLVLVRPDLAQTPALRKTRLTVAERVSTYSVLQQIGETEIVTGGVGYLDPYAVAVHLSSAYRVALWPLYEQIRGLYGADELISDADVFDLRRQIEAHFAGYEIREETVERDIALVRLEGFTPQTGPDGVVAYTAEISYPVDRERLLLSWEAMKDNGADFGFHYTPYNFDSNPEKSFFEQLLLYLNLRPGEVQDLYFTGALTDPAKTDFYVDYEGADGRWHRYTPDFVIRRVDGRCLIVEIKNAQFEEATQQDLERGERGEPALTVEGRKALALKRWETLDPGQLRYDLVFARSDTLAYNDLGRARTFVTEHLAQDPAYTVPTGGLDDVVLRDD